MIGVWHYDEYARVLNMVELHMVLSNIPQNRYLTNRVLNISQVLNMPVLHMVL